MRTVRVPMVAGLLVLAVGMTACEADPVAEPGSQDVEETRVAVRQAASTVLGHLVDDLAGTLHSASGSYAGCSESGTGEVDAVRYTVRGRVDPGPEAPAPLLSVAEPALTAAGFTDTAERDIPGGRSRGATAEDLTVAIAERAGSPWLIVDVAGPCIDVEDDTLLNQAPDDVEIP